MQRSILGKLPVALACLGLAGGGTAALSKASRTTRAERPEATIIYTTDTHGYLQSCGCASSQVGGLAKRATLLRQLRDHAGNAVLVDGGNQAGDLPRAQAVMQCLRLLRYRAVGIGPLDLRLGNEFWKTARRCGLPLTAVPALANGAAPYVASMVNGRRVIVIGLWPGMRIAGNNTRPAKNMGKSDSAAQLSRLLHGLRQRASLMIILSPGTFNEEKELIRSLQQAGAVGARSPVDLVIGMRGAAARQLTKVNGVTFVPATERGQVGFVEVWFDRPTGSPPSAAVAEFRHRFEVVTDDLPADREVQQIVSNYYARQAAELVEVSRFGAADWTRLGYATSHSCAECHVREVDLWHKSRHAHAAETLREKNRLVPECLNCHSELFRRTRRFNPQLGVAWHGIECTTCHGDGVLHAALGVRQHITRKTDEKFCRTCHNPENDPRFDPASYMERIRHWK